MKHFIKSVFVGCAIVGLTACSTTDMQNLVAQGNAMSTSNTKHHAVNPSKVKLFYTGNTQPKQYQVIGRVSAENYNPVGLEHTQESIANELKKQAASIGANGVIHITSGMVQTIGDAVILK